MLKINSGGIFESSEFFSVYQTPRRITTEYELEIYAPCDSFLMLNGTKYPHDTDAVFLAPPGAERFSIGPFSCCYLHFETDEPDLLALLSAIPPCLPLDDADALRKTCLSVAAQDAATPEGRLTQTALLLSLLLSLGKEAQKAELPPPPSSKYIRMLLRAKEYMEENYAEKITLSALASVSFLSKNFFRTLFTEEFGFSPNDYLTKIRVSRAVELFRTTPLPFADIALSCGFGSQAYMNAVIKKQTGKTPRAFRDEEQRTKKRKAAPASL